VQGDSFNTGTPSVGWAMIPPAVLSSDLTPLQKITLGRVIGLASAKGYCYASNAYLAHGMGVAVRTMSAVVGALVRAGHVRREIVRDETTKEVIERRLYPLGMATLPDSVGGGASSSSATSPADGPDEGSHEGEVEFDLVWAAFKSVDRAVGKVAARKAWSKTLRGRTGKNGHAPVAPDVLVNAANNYVLKCKLRGTEPRYIKQPSAFLGPDRHWEDHAEPPKPEGAIGRKSGGRESGYGDHVQREDA